MAWWARASAAATCLGALVSLSAAQSKEAGGKGRFYLEYTITAGKLQACQVGGTLGDDDVDEAVCLLMQRCVEAGNATEQTAATCLRPRLARMIELVNVGLLKELDHFGVAPDDKLEAAQEGDIVVHGRRPPKDGMWLFSESGYRMHHNDLDLPVEQLFPRSWRRCVKGGELEQVLADMMREKESETASSPCPWKMAVQDGTIKGKQVCVRGGFSETGKVTGQYSSQMLRFRKDVRSRQLFGVLSSAGGGAEGSASGAGAETGAPTRTTFLTHAEIRWRNAITYRGTAEGMGMDDTPLERGRSGRSPIKPNGAYIDRSNDQEVLEVRGFRVRDC